ncbi:hypothetical protein K2Y11_08035 [bacterium]|nr:hypothetical protein [bacterium]
MITNRIASRVKRKAKAHSKAQAFCCVAWPMMAGPGAWWGWQVYQQAWQKAQASVASRSQGPSLIEHAYSNCRNN